MGIVRRKKDSREATDTRQQEQTDLDDAQAGSEPPPPQIVTTALIVSYNCRESLVHCLSALEASQARESAEILVVDCGSADGSGQIDSDFPDVNVLRLPRNFGRTKARNIGTRTAKGKYILFLDPGVSVKPDCIATLTAALEADTSAAVVCPVLSNENGQPDPITGPLPSPSDLCQAWLNKEPWETAIVSGDSHFSNGITQVGCGDPRAFMTHSRFVKGMNYFDERYGEFGSEIELFTQAYRAARKTLLVSGAGAVVQNRQTIWNVAPDNARDTLSADYGNGVSNYVSKHHGKMAGLKIRLRMCLRVLFSFRLGLFTQLLAGQKIDGSQTTL